MLDGVPIRGVISDGQHSIRKAAQTVLPDIPHQLCHFHYPREAAKPVDEADRHAKKEMKKHLRGVRSIERAVEHRVDGEADAIRGYCLAVRTALTDDGQPPLEAPGLKLSERIAAITASLWSDVKRDMRGFIVPRISSPMRKNSRRQRSVTAMKTSWLRWSKRKSPLRPSLRCSQPFVK